MDMYQKRKMRQERNAKKNKDQDLNNKMNINWDNPIYVKPLANLYK